ncbi:unnamed protein product [Moneuplotes crassus]|uniref:Uncharacterized protein n=1 Tax=Euplotes crassus TaxID=5936 RepID=A0AAD1XDR3_EUPCR|nr:unnamed protein product [Moneuplotes crassus]
MGDFEGELNTMSTDPDQSDTELSYPYIHERLMTGLVPENLESSTFMSSQMDEIMSEDESDFSFEPDEREEVKVQSGDNQDKDEEPMDQFLYLPRLSPLTHHTNHHYVYHDLIPSESRNYGSLYIKLKEIVYLVLYASPSHYSPENVMNTLYSKISKYSSEYSKSLISCRRLDRILAHLPSYSSLYEHWKLCMERPKFKTLFVVFIAFECYHSILLAIDSPLYMDFLGEYLPMKKQMVDMLDEDNFDILMYYVKRRVPKLSDRYGIEDQDQCLAKVLRCINEEEQMCFEMTKRNRPSLFYA